MEHEYKIKVPIYISEELVVKRDLWGITYPEMVEHIKEKIDSVITSKEEFILNKSNAPSRKKVSPLSCSIYHFETIPYLLVRVKSCTINNTGMYVKKERKMDLKSDDEVGSENHWLLIFPHIINLEEANFKSYLSIFVYADPNKPFQDSVSTAKLFCKKVIKIKFKNIKFKKVLTKLEQRGIISELNIRLSSISEDLNNVDYKCKEYIVQNKIMKVQEEKYINIPINLVKKCINKTQRTNEYQTKKIKIRSDMNNYKIDIDNSIKNSKQLLEEMAEESLNTEISVDEKELEPNILYDKDFIISKLKPVVEYFLKSLIE